MKKKTLGLLILSNILFSFGAFAKYSDIAKNYVVENKVSESATDASKNKLKLIVFKEEVKSRDVVSGTGVYSPELLNKTLNSKMENIGYVNVMLVDDVPIAISTLREIPYNKKAIKTTKKDQSYSVKNQSAEVNEGLSFVFTLKKSGILDLEINQTTLDKMEKVTLADDFKIELPQLSVFSMKSSIKKEEGKVTRYDSSVYEKDGKLFKNIYLIYL